jgi:formate hydrogenlyase subunit 3/multisubunit Na+/H+ antiporter MnhD subunit
VNAPAVLLTLAGLLGVASFLARRRALMSSLIAGVGAALLGALALWVSLDEPIQWLGGSLKVSGSWTVLGRAFVLDDGNRAAVSFIFLVGAFLLTASWAARAVAYLPSFGLLMIASVAASLMIRPFLYAAPLLETAAVGGCLLLVGEKPQSHRAGLRLLTFYTVAMMALLLTGWMLGTAGVTSATELQAERVFVLLAIGLAVLLVVPPFHSWLSAGAQASDPYTLAFVLIVLQSAGLFLFLGFLDSYSWLRESVELADRLRWAGLATVIFGTLWAASQRESARWMAYAIIADVGVTLLLLGQFTAPAYEIALGMAGSRAVGLAVWALGESNLRRSGGQAGERRWASFASLAGASSVAGAPLTAGFPGRWAALGLLASRDVWASACVVASILVLIASMGRRLTPEAKAAEVEAAPVATVRRSLLIGGVLMVVGLGVFPQLLFPWVIRAAQGLHNLIP